MMESLRNFLTGPRLFIVVAACALPFVFLGTSSLSSVFGGSLGTINGESVSELDFQVASNSTIQKFKSIYGDEFEFTDLDESFQMDQIKQELIIQKVLLSESKKLGLHGKNAEIQAKKSIIRNPLFQVDGVFNENVFEAQANANGFTKDNYINMLTDMMATEIYRNSLAVSGFTTPEEVKQIAGLLEQSADFDFIKIDNEELTNSIINTDDERLNFYNDNQVLFYSDEKRSFKYLIVTSDSYKDKVQIPDGYLEDAYKEYLSSTRANTQTRFSHIMIEKNNYTSDEEAYQQIVEIQDLISEGQSFSNLALNYSDDFVTKDIGGDLEYFDADIYPEEFANAISSLEINDTSEIVELDETFHILKITEITQPEVLPYEEMEIKLKNNLIDAEALALMSDDFGVMDSMIISGESIEIIGESLDINIKTNELVSQTSYNFLDKNEAIKSYIFSPDSELNLPSIFELNDSLVIVSLDKIESPYLKNYDEVKESVNKSLAMKKARDKQQLLISEILSAKQDGNLESFIAAYSFITSDNFIDVKRYSSLLPQDIISNIFQSTPGDTINMDSANGDSYIVDLKNFNTPNDESVAELLDQYKAFSNDKISKKLSSIINDNIFDNANINLNENVF